jgi:chromosome segregation ATPase
MIVSAVPQRPNAQFIDWLFSRLPGAGNGEAMQGPPVAGFQLSSPPGGPAGPAGSSSWAGPQPPPILKDPADLPAAHQWLQTEKQRLDEYTRSQFNVIREQHQVLLTKHFRSEEALAQRSQELNREIQFLASQSEALQKRSQELAERETVLASHMERLSQAQEELLSIEQTSQNVRKDTEAQQALLEKLQAETAQLQAVDATARQEFSTFDTVLRDRQQAWERKHAEITARQAQMEDRYLALEKAEAAAERRLAELDELEERLRQELAQPKQPDIRARQAQLEQRYLDLEKAEAAAQRRLDELDELEERLHREFEVRLSRLAATQRGARGDAHPAGPRLNGPSRQG